MYWILMLELLKAALEAEMIGKNPMIADRKLRKVLGRSNALMTVYECDSCLWIVNVPYEKKLPEVQLRYDTHDCTEKPLRQKSGN